LPIIYGQNKKIFILNHRKGKYCAINEHFRAESCHAVYNIFELQLNLIKSFNFEVLDGVFCVSRHEAASLPALLLPFRDAAGHMTKS
jgi:hypothetical protein